MQFESEELDISRLLGGDRRSWEDFVKHYAPIIYSAIIRLLKTYCGHADSEQAADLTQVVFMNLVKANYRLLRNYDARKASMATWLRLIARSRSLDVLRKRRIVTQPLDSLASGCDRVSRRGALSGAHHWSSGARVGVRQFARH